MMKPFVKDSKSSLNQSIRVWGAFLLHFATVTFGIVSLADCSSGGRGFGVIGLTDVGMRSRGDM